MIEICLYSVGWGEEMVLGTRLRQLRIKKSQSLQKVADSVGASKAHIWELETGKSSNPSIALLTKLADHFGVGIAYLVGEDVSTDQGQIGTMFRQVREELDEEDQAILRDMVESLIRRRRERDDAD